MIVSIAFKGHFICAEDCQWYMHHHVDNKFCVSSIGEYIVSNDKYANKDGFSLLGAYGYYETMVFTISNSCDVEECNCPHGGSYELISRRYDTRQEAENGHNYIISICKDEGNKLLRLKY